MGKYFFYYYSKLLSCIFPPKIFCRLFVISVLINHEFLWNFGKTIKTTFSHQFCNNIIFWFCRFFNIPNIFEFFLPILIFLCLNPKQTKMFYKTTLIIIYYPVYIHVCIYAYNFIYILQIFDILELV